MPYQLPVRPRPSAKKWYVLVIPDTHVGYIADTPTYSIGCWDITMQALDKLQRRLTHVVLLGDFGNWESLSHWQSLRADQAYVEEDVALCNARLDEVEAVTSRRGISVSMCEGNHEAWASQLEAKYPNLRNTLNLQRRLRFRERGWKWVRENHLLRLGDAHFTHGHVRGTKTPLEMVKNMGVSVIYGHTHRYRTESFRNATGEHAAWEMGCLASIDPPPPYAKGELPRHWVHGLGLVQVRASGRFQVSFRRMLDESWTELEDGTELLADPRRVRARYDQDQRIRERLRAEYADRYYSPTGNVHDLEPHHGKTAAGNAVARTRRARIIRTLPEQKG